MSNNIVTRTGEIQEGNDLSLRSPNQYKNYFERALTGHGWNFTETDAGNGGYLKYRLTHEDGTIKDIHVYLKPVVWRNRHVDEKAAQMSASLDMRGFEAVENGELLYVFGIYRDPTSSGDPNSQDDEYVICSWMPTEWGANRGQAAFNYFIRTDVISEAFKIGFSSAIERGRTVYSFRPESLYYYITNQAELHQDIADLDVVEISTPSSIDLKEEFCRWFIKQDGIKHNYYSTTFGSNKDKLLENLTKYEEIYNEEFGTPIFEVPRENNNEFIQILESNLYQDEGDFFQFSSKTSTHMPRAILGKKNYLQFLSDFFNSNQIQIIKPQVPFEVSEFQNNCNNAGLVYTDKLITRFVSSLLTKPFIILTGLSGSGKTKLAQAYVQWICQEESQYRIIPVGADWTNREPLLGYPNALKPEEYVKPDSGVIDLIIQANSNPELPHFLILDEMNLSHVERYFADFLSVMESKEEIPMYAEGTVDNGVPSKLKVPANLFIIGTVNIDETTNMFSPKVLDRANTIEFRIDSNEMEDFLNTANDLNMKALIKKGANMAQSFISLSNNKSFTTKDLDAINKTLLNFFGELQKTGAEFGYRSANEILRLINQLDTLNNKITTSEKIDIAIMQKLLPKLHGSRRKLSPILETLGSFCLTEDLKVVKDVFDKDDFDYSIDKVLYPLSLEKIARMYKGAVDNGFASYAEA